MHRWLSCWRYGGLGLNVMLPWWRCSHVRACVLVPGIAWVFVWRQLQGDIVPLKFTGNPPIPPANLPNFNGSESQYYLELQLSSYTLMSAVWTFYQAGAVIVSAVAAGAACCSAPRPRCRFVLWCRR